MLLKPFTAYVAGVATVAFAHSCASGEPGKLGFGLGVVTAFLLLAWLPLRQPTWLLGSTRRQQRAGKFLLRLSGADSPKVKTSAPVTCEKTAQEKPQIRKDDSPVFTDVVLALRGMGADKSNARWAAGQATMRLPEGDFEEIFKLAVRTLRPLASRSASA